MSGLSGGAALSTHFGATESSGGLGRGQTRPDEAGSEARGRGQQDEIR